MNSLVLKFLSDSIGLASVREARKGVWLKPGSFPFFEQCAYGKIKFWGTAYPIKFPLFTKLCPTLDRFVPDFCKLSDVGRVL